jgi:predicted amidohydrolase YtcJ
MVADAIYSGGDIVTIDDDHPTAEALAVKDGRILAVGTLEDVSKVQGKTTRNVDLGGKTLLPGFVDPHSHLSLGLAMADWANVSAPPVGPVTNPQEIVAELSKFARARGIASGDVVVGYGYDDSLMPAGHALTRDHLDPAFPDNPVLVLHVSGHGAVLNTAAMVRYGLSASTPTPPGGVIMRRPGSLEPTGLVMETAWLPIHAQMPVPTPEQQMANLIDVQGMYAAAGVTTAQDGAATASEIAALDRGAQAGLLYVDVVAYVLITELDAVLADHPASKFGRYDHRLKLGGCKLVADGSPQGRTAFFTTPYLTGGPGGDVDWKGEPTFPQQTLDAMFAKCYSHGLNVNVHANGDAAIDAAIHGHESAAALSPDVNRRTVVIHSQFVRRDQLQRYVADRLIPSMFTVHTFYFGAAHVANRGLEQASFLSPMNTALTMGLRPTNHTDFNVVPIDQMRTVATAVNRTMRDGQVLGPDERITPLQALKAITIDAAFQYGEEDTKGSLEVGKLADLVILDRNPLSVDPTTLQDIRVVETIKEGATVFPADRTSKGP